MLLIKNDEKTSKGRKSEESLLEIIRAYFGLSLYELAKKAKWTVGHLDGTIRRLLNSGEFFITVLERDGRRVNLVYPKEKSSNIIEVPKTVSSRKFKRLLKKHVSWLRLVSTTSPPWMASRSPGSESRRKSRKIARRFLFQLPWRYPP